MRSFDFHSCLHSVSLFLLPSRDLFTPHFLGSPSLHPLGVESIAEKQGDKSGQVLKSGGGEEEERRGMIQETKIEKGDWV